MTTESVKISSKILNRIRDRKILTGVSITRFIEISLEKELKEIEQKEMREKIAKQTRYKKNF